MTLRPLRPYQVEACAAIEDEWTRVRSTLLVAATGTGKTRMGSEIIARRAPHGRVLWLAHRNELLDQAQQAIIENTGLRVGREQASQRSAVRALWGQDDQCVVASIQTMHGERLTRYFKPEDFDTIIVDEAHHAVADLYRNVLSYFAEAKLLGVTATPDRGDEVGLANVFETVAFQYDILQGIADGYLCDIQSREIVVADLDIAKVKVTASMEGGKDLNATQLARAMDNDGTMHAIAGPLHTEAGERQTIVFTPSVDMAHHLADVLRGYVGARNVRSIDGTTAKLERLDALKAFRSGAIQFLVNCAVLTEGFDAPETACVAICRPTKSRALYAQMIGRGTRIAPGKVDCLVLDFVPEQAGRHKLMTPLDVLGGKDIDDETAKEARKLSHDGMPSTEALAEAERRKAERQEQARLKEEARIRNLRIQSPYRSRHVDPFGCVRAEDVGGSSMTSATASTLTAFGIELPANMPEAAAKRVLDEAFGRRRRGECSYKQARNFARWGLRTDIPIREAGGVIDQIIANGPNGWRNDPPPAVIAKWGKA